jgi:hypothetical protein
MHTRRGIPQALPHLGELENEDPQKRMHVADKEGIVFEHTLK